MSLGLGTRGYLGGGGAATAPTITIVSPTPDVVPGSPGGFPADWATARVTPIVIDIDGDELTFAEVVAHFPGDDGLLERSLYRRGAFRDGFTVVSSSEQVTSTKLRLTVLPDAGWPSFAALASLKFDVDAVAGGALSVDAGTYTFRLPVAPALVPVSVETTFDPIPTIDPIALALARMPQQYRGVDDVATDLIA